MSSEEMRIELERFVNAGLQEGWHGWPRKADGCLVPRFCDRLPAAADRAGQETQDHANPLAERCKAFGTTRLFDWERRMIWAGARFASQQSRS